MITSSPLTSQEEGICSYKNKRHSQISEVNHPFALTIPSDHSFSWLIAAPLMHQEIDLSKCPELSMLIPATAKWSGMNQLFVCSRKNNRGLKATIDHISSTNSRYWDRNIKNILAPKTDPSHLVGTKIWDWTKCIPRAQLLLIAK